MGKLACICGDPIVAQAIEVDPLWLAVAILGMFVATLSFIKFLWLYITWLEEDSGR